MVPCVEELLELPPELVICGVCVVVLGAVGELVDAVAFLTVDFFLVVVFLVGVEEVVLVPAWLLPVVELDVDAVAVSVEMAIQPARPRLAALAVATAALLHWRLRAISRSG